MTDDKLILQAENEQLRNDIEEVIFLNEFSSSEKLDLWKLINLLINNEIELEKFCNQ